MINLKANLRTFLLQIPEFTDIISDYKDSKAIFTRRPVPEDATYPMCVISDITTGLHQDYLVCDRVTIGHNIIVYGQNDEASKFVEIENAGFILANAFHHTKEIEMPSGVTLINCTATVPTPAPADNNDTVARVVTVNLEIKY